MTIGFLTTSLSAQNGWGRYSKSLVEAVGAHTNVRVLTSKHAQNDTSLHHIRACLPWVSFQPWIQVRVFWHTWRTLRGCDVIHALVEPYAPGAALAARLMGARFIMTLHGTYSAPPPGWSFHRLFLKFALRSSTLTTSGSPRTEARAREVVDFAECRFIPNGVDATVFHTISDVTIKPMILTTGAVKPRKGADTVIRALGLLKDELPSLRYIIIGDTSQTTFVEYIRSIAREQNISERVELLGIVSDEDVRRAYNECTAFVLASRDAGGQFEGFPMVYFEANACGAPVITTKGYGSEYAVHDGENGFLVPENDHHALADAIRKIMRDPPLRARMRESSLKMAAEHTWPCIATEHLVPFYADALRA